MKQLIITGDDFGLSIAVNKAIEIAHRNGILSTTSIMMGEQATADAVSRAKNLPDLHVGLHITLVQGTPVLAPELIPDLVTKKGVFRDDLFITGVRFFFKPGIRRQLEAEIHAQFQAFSETGLNLDHVNAHNHMHLHPTILGLILKIGRQYNMQAIRIPYEPIIKSKRVSPMQLFENIFLLIFLAPWTLWMRWRLKKASIFSNDYIFGLNDTSGMYETLLLELIHNLPNGSTEIYFHPVENEELTSGSNDNTELQALISPKVKALLEKIELKPRGFSDLTH